MAVPRYTLAALLIGLVLAGCATPPKDNPAQAEIDQEILRAAEKIQLAQADLYQAGALNESTAKKAPSIDSDENKITLSWQGDALQLLNGLAHTRGLAFMFMGVRMPLPVNIDVKDASYDSVMQMVQAQIGYRAEVEQHPDKLVLQYNKPRS